MAKAQTYLKEHAAQITAIAGEDSEVSNLVNSVTSMPEAAQNAAEEAAKKVDAKTKEAGETAKSDAKAKVNEAAAKANAKINEGNGTRIEPDTYRKGGSASSAWAAFCRITNSIVRYLS